MIRPLSDRDLVRDQPVRRVGVRDAQQRLGEAHEHHTLLRREPVLLQKGLDPGLALAAAAGRDHERDRVLAHGFAVGGRQSREREQLRNDGFLVGEEACVDGASRGGLESGVVGTQEARRASVLHARF